MAVCAQSKPAGAACVRPRLTGAYLFKPTEGQDDGQAVQPLKGLLDARLAAAKAMVEHVSLVIKSAQMF